MRPHHITLIVDGQVQRKTMQGESADALRRQLEADRQVVIDIREKGGLRIGRRAPAFALTLFLQELSTLLQAGLVLTEALEALRDKSDTQADARHVIDAIVATMQEGRPFSAALKQHPEIFPALLIATVESSEGTGQLPVMLTRYQEYGAKVEQLRKRIVGALIYPIVVITVGFGVLMFMAFFIVPRFAAVFESMTPRSANVEAMLWWSNLLDSHGLWVGLAMLLMPIGLIAAAMTTRFKRLMQRLMWKLPKLGGVCTLFALTRFYRTVGLLIVGGTPVIAALRLSRQVLPEHLHGRLSAALTAMETGVPASVVLKEQALTTSVAERLLRVGEQSGDFGGMCEHVAQFHDKTLDRAVELLSKVFEPVLMLVVGATVGAALIMLYMPIFGLADSVG